MYLKKVHIRRNKVINIAIIVDIRSGAWLNLFWEFIHGTLFAVMHAGSRMGGGASKVRTHVTGERREL